MSRREIEPSVEAFKLLGLITDMGPITVGDLFELAKSEEIFSSSATMRTRLWGLEFAGAVQVEVPPHLKHYTSTYSDEYVVTVARGEVPENRETRDLGPALRETREMRETLEEMISETLEEMISEGAFDDALGRRVLTTEELVKVASLFVALDLTSRPDLEVRVDREDGRGGTLVVTAEGVLAL